MRYIQTLLTLSVFLIILFMPTPAVADSGINNRSKIRDPLIKEVFSVIEKNYVTKVNFSSLFQRVLGRIKKGYVHAMELEKTNSENYKIVCHEQTMDFPVSQNDHIANFRTLEKILQTCANQQEREKLKEDLDQFLLKELLLSLDPRSQYVISDEFTKISSFNAGSTGINFDIRDDTPTVISTINNSPAYKAGIKAGDRIIQIDGKSTKYFTASDTIEKLRGPIDTKVTLTMIRDISDKPLDFVILRSNVKRDSISFKELKDDIGYIRFSSFDGNGKSSEIMRKALQEGIERKGFPYKGLILDLRDNTGGIFSDVINVADLFLKSGTIVSTRGRIRKDDRKYVAENNGDEPTCPIVVLVNKNTASGAEVIAGALKDNGLAVIIGVKTDGRGSIQTVIPLNNGDLLKLTTAWLYTPNGISIIDNGIEPNIVVKGDFPGKGEDIQLQRAIENVSKKPVMNMYYLRLWSKVRRQWSLLSSKVPKETSEAIVFTNILRDGSIMDVRIERRSGNQAFDDSAMRAVQSAAPFPPLPKEVTENSIELRFRFHSSDLQK